MEEILFKWIPQVGFPIAVATYVLIRIEPRLNKLSDAILQLLPVIEEDSSNTKDVKEAITELKVAIAKLNGRGK